jgi:hypothetical protein
MGLKWIARKETITDHYVAASAAALAAWKWSLWETIWCYPAHLPHHPYDFAC